VAILSECADHGIEHVLLAKRLGQKIDRAGFHRLHRHGDVAVCRREVERKSALSLQPYVQHHARGSVGQREHKERLRRVERLHVEAHGAQQAAERVAHRFVVVDDADESAGNVAGSCSAHGCDTSTEYTGTMNSSVAPGVPVDAAQMRPPCASRIERQMDNPMPIPSGLVV
jgi:hypothetical protein